MWVCPDRTAGAYGEYTVVLPVGVELESWMYPEIAFELCRQLCCSCRCCDGFSRREIALHTCILRCIICLDFRSGIVFFIYLLETLCFSSV
jgi:hypothetical protein